MFNERLLIWIKSFCLIRIFSFDAKPLLLGIDPLILFYRFLTDYNVLVINCHLIVQSD